MLLVCQAETITLVVVGLASRFFIATVMACLECLLISVEGGTGLISLSNSSLIATLAVNWFSWKAGTCIQILYMSEIESWFEIGNTDIKALVVLRHISKPCDPEKLIQYQ